jgi:hypothetical protein
LLLWNLILRLNSTKIVRLVQSKQVTFLRKWTALGCLLPSCLRFTPMLLSIKKAPPMRCTLQIIRQSPAEILAELARKSPQFRSDAVTSIPSFTAAVSNVSAVIGRNTNYIVLLCNRK